MKIIRFILLLFIFPTLLTAQDPKRFEEEVSRFFNSKETYDVVFTGSSSIRLWKTLTEDFPKTQLINTGFGGSQMQDLAYYIEDVVISYKPSRIFIYEGDNDINDGKTVRQILIKTEMVVEAIHNALPNSILYFISAKPSPSRFHLKSRYEYLNSQLKEFCSQRDNIEFVDVWTAMINEEGVPIPDIFIEDQLHMNQEGYAIWKEVLAPYLD